MEYIFIIIINKSLTTLSRLLLPTHSRQKGIKDSGD